MHKSRLEEDNNIRYQLTKNPYGKENVKITEDVLQKYSI